MSWIEITIIIIGVVILNKGFDLLILNKKSSNGMYVDLIGTYQTDLQTLKRQNTEQLTQILLLKDKIKNLELRLVLMESGYSNTHAPSWLKDLAVYNKERKEYNFGVMRYVNEAYEEKYLKPINKTKYDYEGKTDVDVFGIGIAKNFAKNDIEAAKKGIWVGMEKGFPNDLFIKIARYQNNKLIGILGFSIPLIFVDKNVFEQII